MLRTLAILPLVALTFAAGSCNNSEPTPAAALALQATARQSTADTARFTMKATIEFPGSEEPIEFAARGQTDMARGLTEIVHEPPEGGTVHTIFDNGRMYQTWLDTGYWQSGDAGASSTFSAAPEDILRILERSEKVEDLGRETIAGFETMHYRATITQAMFESQGTDLYRGVSGTFDVWAANDRILRVVSTTEYGEGAIERLRGQRSTVRIDWSDWGAPVAINIPDPSLVKSIEELHALN